MCGLLQGESQEAAIRLKRSDLRPDFPGSGSLRQPAPRGCGAPTAMATAASVAYPWQSVRFTQSDETQETAGAPSGETPAEASAATALRMKDITSLLKANQRTGGGDGCDVCQKPSASPATSDMGSGVGDMSDYPDSLWRPAMAAPEGDVSDAKSAIDHAPAIVPPSFLLLLLLLLKSLLRHLPVTLVFGTTQRGT